MLAIFSVALLSAAAWAGGASPEKPNVQYYFLNVEGTGPDVGEMDGRLKGIADAFGRGEFARCRELGEALIELSDDEGLRAEAVTYVVESYVAEGDFDGARAGIKDMLPTSPETCRDLLAEVNGREREYNAQVARLQHIVASSDEQETAARAQLRTAHLHRICGRLELADRSYRKVVERYPLSREAGAAFGHLSSRQWEAGDHEGAIRAWMWAVDTAPDHALGARACEFLSMRFAQAEGRSYEGTRQRLSAIAARHPGTQVADIARFGIGRLYLIEGVPELAERKWTYLIMERHGSPVLPEVQASLLELRYDLGMKAFEQADYEGVVRWLDPMVSDPSFAGRHQWKSTAQSQPHISLAKQRTAVFQLAQAYQHLERWDDAAETFLLIATPDCDMYEGAALPCAESLYEADRWEEAREMLVGFIADFPESALVVHARDLIRRMGGDTTDPGAERPKGEEPCEGC